MFLVNFKVDLQGLSGTMTCNGLNVGTGGVVVCRGPRGGEGERRFKKKKREGVGVIVEGVGWGRGVPADTLPRFGRLAFD